MDKCLLILSVLFSFFVSYFCLSSILLSSFSILLYSTLHIQLSFPLHTHFSFSIFHSSSPVEIYFLYMSISFSSISCFLLFLSCVFYNLLSKSNRQVSSYFKYLPFFFVFYRCLSSILLSSHSILLSSTLHIQLSFPFARNFLIFRSTFFFLSRVIIFSWNVDIFLFDTLLSSFSILFFTFFHLIFFFLLSYVLLLYITFFFFLLWFPPLSTYVQSFL